MKKYDQRMARLREIMLKRGNDLLVLGPGPHLDWLLGFHPHPDERPCLFFLNQSGAAFLMPALNAQDTKARCALPLFEWADEDGPTEALGLLLSSLRAKKAKKVVLDETMRADFALLFLGALESPGHEFSEDTLGLLRMCKDAEEFAELKMNSEINDRALMAGVAAYKPGMTERDFADAMIAHYATEGAVTTFSIVGANENGAFPHHKTGGRVLKPGDAVVVDIGGKKGDYLSDMTRMVAIDHPPEGYAEIHAIVEAASQAALKAARPGVLAKDVDAAARSVITKAGYGENFVHRTGHGLGLEIHEPPWITSTSETVLLEGMVFSIEPGIYFPGRFGVRLEDIVFLGADGPRILSGLSRDLITIRTR